jgi:hypothetical protein
VLGSTDVTALMPSGSPVGADEPVAQATYGGTVMLASLKPADILKFLAVPQSARAEIDGSAGPFDCTLLDPRPSIASDGSSFIACVVPDSVVAIAGLTGVVAVKFPSFKDVVALPLTAVAGSLTEGEVLKKVAGKFVPTRVGLGVSNGQMIQITSGLQPGDAVRIPGPSLTDG